MIRKISTQDVVSKQSSKNEETTRRERDFLIERLNRKHTTASIADSPAKVKRQSKKNIKFANKWIWFSAPVVLIVILFFVLQFMVSADVLVNPKQSTVQVDSKLLASLSSTSSPNSLSYQIITLNTEDSETVAASGTVPSKPKKASGQITIFNNYTSAPQTLVQNTRFQTPEGLIYRIQNTIQVPGISTQEGKSVPGSITVTVIADQVGSKYNINLSDFNIPGFANDQARYNKIFARSKTTMTGGLDENTFGVSEADRQAAQNKIETRLRDNLLRQAQSQKTANSIIFDSASKISFSHMADTPGADSKHVVIHEQGTISSVAFDKKALGKLLVGNALNEVGAMVPGNSAELHGLEGLHFIAAVASTSPVWQSAPFTFTLTGPINVVGVVNTNKFLQDIKGISKSSLNSVLANYPTIDKVKVILKPFWKTSFPNDASKIKIEIVK